jgi:predicted dehydrogenase
MPDAHQANRREFLVHTAGALTAMAIMPELARSASHAASPISVGLIGAGKQGRAIMAELAKFPGVTLSAVCDSDESRRSAAGKRATGAEMFADHAAMLSKKPDLAAVIIATPTHLHKQIALDAISAGRHVYCEAPLAHTIEDCRVIAQAAAKSAGVFAAGFEGRSNPVYKLARTFFRSDSVRDLAVVETGAFKKDSWRVPESSGDAERAKAMNWRLDPAVSLGLAGEWMSQQFDVAQWYTDATPVEVRGYGAVRTHKDGRTIADTASCELLLDNGSTVRSSASLANSYLGRYELFRGSNAAIRLAWSHGWMFKEADAPTQGWEVYANRQQFHNDEGITLIADATKLAEQNKLKEGVGLPESSLWYALSDFLKACASGGKPACDAQAGAKTTIVSILAAQAVARNERVTIDPAALQF